MTADELRNHQGPLKLRYKTEPETAKLTLHATGTLDADALVCKVETWRGAVVEAGLHPSAGGDGSEACAGEMLLQALIGCAGVTLRAVATAMSIPLRGGSIRAEGDFDVSGTLGVRKDVPIGFTAIRLTFDLDTDANDEQLASLLKLTERYCVVYQTLANPPKLDGTMSRRTEP